MPCSLNKYCIIIVSTALCALFVFAGCGGIEKLESTWRDREVVIDGFTDEDEWESARYIYEKPNFTLGLMNDDKYIYLSLATSDEVLVKKISGYGFTVWFNDTGKKDTTLGFHYPVGMRRRGMDRVRQERSGPQNGEGTQDREENRERQQPMGSDGMENRMNDPFIQCAIYIYETREIFSMAVEQASEYGIEAAITVENGLLVYEMKFPLVRSEITPYAIGNGTSEIVGIGSFTGAMPRPRTASRSQNSGMVGRGGGMGGGMSGGSMGGSGMGGSIPGGGSMGGLDPLMFEATKVWLKTELARASE